MNYGAEPADQVVRYSLEGMEYSLKITGNVAKHVAVFIAAALKDQKKTRGKTRLTRMLKEQRPMKRICERSQSERYLICCHQR